jgi:hypothetical protein
MASNRNNSTLSDLINEENWKDAKAYLEDSGLSNEQKKNAIRNENAMESCLHSACRHASDSIDLSFDLIKLILEYGGSDLILKQNSSGETAEQCASNNTLLNKDGRIFELLRQYRNQAPQKPKERKSSTTQGIATYRMGIGLGSNSGRNLSVTNDEPKADNGGGISKENNKLNEDDYKKRTLILLELYINCEFQRQMHRLAQDFFRKREVWFHFFPVTLLTMASGALAFLATADIIVDRTREILSITVGICSIISVAFQSCAKFSNYGARSEMHKAVALGMKRLGDNINFQQIDPEKGAMVIKRRNDNDKSNEEKILDYDSLGPHYETMSETVEGFRMVFNQIMDSNDSTIPTPIGQAFSLVDSRLSIMLNNSNTEENIKDSLKVSKDRAKSIITAATYCELYTEISNGFWWPLYPTNPHRAVKNSIEKVTSTYIESHNFLKLPTNESTPLLP